MNKLLSLFVFLSLGLAPLQAQVSTANAFKTDSVQRPMLAKLRAANARTYADFKQRERLLQFRRTEAKYRFRPCEPCDTRYVAQLLNKSESLTRSEIKNLICTYEPSCRDNAEYMPMFNELVHKLIQQNPAGFFDQYEAPQQSQYREALAQALMNPVRDNVDTRTILETIRSRVQEQRVRSNRTSNISSSNLLESLETRLQADIEKKRQDRILRLQQRQE